MKRKGIKTILTLCMVLAMLFGNVLSVSAEETTEELYYSGAEVDETGKYYYVIRSYTGAYGSGGNGYIYEVKINTTSPLTGYKTEDDGTEYVTYNFGDTAYEDGRVLALTHEYVSSTTTYVDKDMNVLWTKEETNSVGTWKVYEDLDGYIETNAPIFSLKTSAWNYLETLNDSDATNKKPVVNQSLYFKNVGYTVRAENSSEYPDETYITFTWDTDNLQSGDCLEIMTKNHYTKIGGDQVIGFHNYLTASSGIDCFVGSYEMSQTSAVKAWFETVENKPLVFKEYDTDIYFLRPVRGNQQGLWVRVTMGRTTPTSSPYITGIEYGEFTEEGEWIKDDNATVSEGGDHGIDQGGNIITNEEIEDMIQLDNIGDLFKYLINNLEVLVGYFGQLPQLINTVIGWLPAPIIVLICCSIAVVILLRIFGR